jgi:hypothetical protein
MLEKSSDIDLQSIAQHKALMYVVGIDKKDKYLVHSGDNSKLHTCNFNCYLYGINENLRATNST